MAPFVDPDLAWDFRLPRVASINASGHKYGLVHPGVGWVIWRDAAALPEELIFWVNYLGDNMPTFALNFSRPGAQVVAQYYNFLRLGFDGYRRVQGFAREVATRLSAEIEALGPFRLITRGDELPVFAFALKDEVDNFTVFDVSMAAARGRLAGSRLHLPGQPHRPGRAPGGGPPRLHPRHRRPAPAGPEAGPPAPGEAARARARRHQHQRLPPLAVRHRRPGSPWTAAADTSLLPRSPPVPGHPPQGEERAEHPDDGPEAGRERHRAGRLVDQQQRHPEGELEQPQGHPVAQPGPLRR